MKFVTLLFALLSLIAFPLRAQTPASLVSEPIDETQLVTLRGNVHPLAQDRYDLGLADFAVPTGPLLLQLNRPVEREAALAQYLKDVHTLGSANYHQWITPEEFGTMFGSFDSDIQAVSSWLGAQGFQVTRVSKGKTLVEFSGTLGQANAVFHTAIHRYEVNGELHYANSTDPQIPAALAGIVAGISGLNDFHAKPATRVIGTAHLDPRTRKLTPEFTLTGLNGTFYGVGPEDFATQYDLGPLYSNEINGYGVTIGVINDSNIDESLDKAYRSLFGLSNNLAQVVTEGGDPGVNADELEAYLDVELAGAVAPSATVNLYIAASDTLDDPLVLAMQRAIEDNLADVLSISFGSCEANLGTAHNQILFSLWQQAAAQGQTALVSAGDNGSAGCDNPEQADAINGLAVNGLASTPWNVAVGGTDFYYSDYAKGAPSAATLWNAQNDAHYGSLKATLPEQVWNDPFGFNAAPPQIQTIYAGSGGVSTVYPKPSWQAGTGVPNDGKRDLPDVSLFAADGVNLSGYVICANPGDCTVDSSGQIPVTVVGGTSASTQAMAGIMALIAQKYGRQGQANFVLYPLAQQVSPAFHDITLGGNNVPCLQDSIDCVLGTSGTDNGQYTLSGYPATAGYDLASGLGSIDGNELVSNWNKIAFLPTITTLQLSSTTFAHGTPVTLTADVTHSSGSAAPTGNVAILTNSPLAFNQTEGVLPIGANGSASGSIDYLPGGSYELWASYAGDGNYSGGTSSPVSLTVSPEVSSISISSPYHSSGGTLPYGDTMQLVVQPKGAVSGLTNATGSVAFTLDSQPAVSVPLNVKGIAIWNTPASTAPGLHSVTANYAGDASYSTSQSAPFTYTVTPSQVMLNVGPGGVCNSSNLCTAYAGDTIPVEVSLECFGVAVPTGTVNVTIGSQSQTVAISLEGFYEQKVLTGIAEFSNLAPGTYAISATYSGDSNYSPASDTVFSLTVIAPSGTRIPTTTTISEASTTVTYPLGGMGGFTVTVTGAVGSNSPPTGNVNVYANGQWTDIIALAPSGTNSASGSSGPQAGDYFNLGVNQITAVYSGDITYQESVSAPIILTAVEAGLVPDFTVAAGAPQITVAKGGSGSVPINFASVWGFSETVSLACTSSTANLACSVSPTSLALNGNAVATLTVTSNTTSGAFRGSSTRSQLMLWLSAAVGLVVFGFVAVSSNRHKWQRLVLASIPALVMLWVACGGGGKSSSQPPPPPPPPPAVNDYQIVLSATSANGTIHSTTVIVVLQ